MKKKMSVRRLALIAIACITITFYQNLNAQEISFKWCGDTYDAVVGRIGEAPLTIMNIAPPGSPDLNWSVARIDYDHAPSPFGGWFSLNPNSGSIPAGGSQTVTMRCNAAGLPLTPISPYGIYLWFRVGASQTAGPLRFHWKIVATPNLVRNGEFCDFNNWTVYRPNAISGTINQFGNVRLVINNHPSDGNLQLYQIYMSLVRAKRYRLEFDASSSDGSPMFVSLLKHTSPFTQHYGKTVNLDNFMTHYTYEFTSPVTASDVRLRFYFGWHCNVGTVYEIDRVILREISLGKEGGEQMTTPLLYALEQNFPNPFNPTTNISFSIPNDGNVSLKVFDLLGREVATLVNETRVAGSYTETFDASRLSSGTYFYRLESGSFVQTKKMIVVK